jgi:hypothetical protein
MGSFTGKDTRFDVIKQDGLGARDPASVYEGEGSVRMDALGGRHKVVRPLTKRCIGGLDGGI